MIQFRDVHYQVKDKQILTAINFAISTGEAVTIVGPSGSGKSTILKLLAKIISPSSGSIEVNEQNISTLPSASYRQQVSYCFQQPVLFGKNVRDNFQFVYDIRAKEYYENHVLETLASLDLKPEILDQEIADLSGGEKQRVALARNTIFMPQVLLLDEVTTGLDLTTKSLILDWLADLNAKQNVTIIKVTHEEDEIAASTRLLEVNEGRLTENGK